MQAFRRSGSAVEASFEDIEVAVLTNLTEQVLELIQVVRSGRAREDAAGRRLFPDAYDGDDEAAEEFRRFTITDLADAKRADAGAVLDTLREHDGLPVTEGGVTTVRIDRDRALAWMRAITDLRLSLDARLSDPTDELTLDMTDDDMRSLGGMYDWLSFVQGTLIEAVEELDEG